MYIKDIAKFAWVILIIIEIIFIFGWYQIQLLLFCQLIAIISSRPQALLDL
jgi:hypothetical protein